MMKSFCGFESLAWHCSWSSFLLAWFGFRYFLTSEQKVPMKKRNFNLRSHLVAFLDVQGQRERFRQLRLPKNPEGSAAVGEALRQTAGFVLIGLGFLKQHAVT